MRVIIDIEANNLLGPALNYNVLPFKLKDDFRVWCIVIRHLDTHKVVSLKLETLTRDNLKAALSEVTEIIGHNIVVYDLPVLQLYGLIDYTIGYPGQESTVFGKPCKITDTLIWSKLLNADRLGGHSLEEWGKRFGEHKGVFSDWSQYSEEMLVYCVQDTKVNEKLHYELIKEAGTWDFSNAYAMEIKLSDLTLKQEVFGFDFNSELAYKNIEELTKLMQEIAEKVKPILPKKKLNQSALKLYIPPACQFKKDGSMGTHMINFLTRLNIGFSEGIDSIVFEGKLYDLPLTAPLKTEEDATIEDLEVVKGYLLSLGWNPSETKERDLTKNSDKTARTHLEILDTIERYAKQTESSLFCDLRCELLGCDIKNLRSFLIGKIDGSKPIYVPTSPKLAVGLEKEICPNLVKMGEQAEFVGGVVKYYTYRHRKNSIAGGVLDEDDEPATGFLANVREDGRIPTPADTLGANTGRYRHKIVCNIPRVTSLYGENMRNLFGPGKGLYQLGFDFASLEARVMGHYVIRYKDGNDLAKALVAVKPFDIHSLNAKKLGIDRNSAKSFSYAAIYGAQPAKLAKMLGISLAKAKELYNGYWEAVPALKELKEALEAYWKAHDSKYILGLDGRRLVTRSKHSLVNVLFQSGGAIVAKWSTVRIAQLLEEQNLLGNPFVHARSDVKVWFMIAMHDEMQMALHPSLVDVKLFATEEEAKAAMTPECSAIGHGSKGYYLVDKFNVSTCISEGIAVACKELKTKTEMGMEYILGRSWGQCH